MSYQSALHSLSPSTTTVVVDAEVEVDEEDIAPWLVTELLLCLLVCCLVSCCSSCYRVPGSEYQHGSFIRRQAQRIRENERRRKARHDKYTDEERQQQIYNDSTIQTMIVIEIDLQTGYYKLGPIDNTTTTMTKKISTHNDEVSSEVHTKETNIGMHMSIESKPSTDTSDTVPFESDSESESDHNNDCNEDIDDDDDDNDYDGVCHICLDGFNIGDTVMFHNNGKMDMNRKTKDCSGGDSNSGKNSNEPQLIFSNSCGHVFHKECIMQWLVERRENGCPSCRSVFINFDDDSCDSNINNEDEVENNIVFGNNNNNTNNDNDSDSDSIAIEVDLEKGILHDNNNNDSNNSHRPNLNDTIIMEEEITNNDNSDNDNKENGNNGDNNNDNPITYYIAHGRILAV